MKKRNGFTLIELLAVIVILAVIALISTPIVLNIIDETKKGALQNTAYGIIEAGKLSYTDEMLETGKIDSTAFTYVDGVETSNPSGKKLEYKGKKPESGTLVINDEGKIALAIYYGNYCAEKGYDEIEPTISEKTKEECNLIFNADLSGASAPKLSANMVPIKWDGTKWIKADVNNILGDNQWYDYDKQEWANVALINNSSRAIYVDASVGTAISEAQVMAYLVWVPRYRYKLFNVAGIVVPVQKIDVVFETKTTTKSNGTTDGTYLTHPAFTFGTDELDGFWVGKFETTGDATTPTVKPNNIALTSQAISAQFVTSKLFNTTTTYGLTNANDAHLARSMEWAAVGYLSQSDYGKYGNPMYTGAAGLEKDIYMNNLGTSSSGPSITGCAANAVSTTELISATCPSSNQYYTTQGVKASTTGNIYGIYDMVGGSWEPVMGAMYNSDNNTIMLLNSGFDSATINSASMSKYIDKYTYGTTPTDQTAYNRKKLGDSTSETRNWTLNYSHMVYSSFPWVERGGRYANGSYTGILGFYYSNGDSSANRSFRTIIIGD